MIMTRRGKSWSGEIFDFWAAAYYGKKAILNLKTDAAEIARLYGDRRKWEIAAQGE